MKLFAQHGYGPSDKLEQGLRMKAIDGVILSSRYTRPDKAKAEVAKIRKVSKKAEILIDPEYCAASVIGSPNAQLGYLEEWPHFRPLRMVDFLVKKQEVDQIVDEALTAQDKAGATSLIAPSVYIPTSLDSMEAALALSFFEYGAMQSDYHEKRTYATLALHRDALLNRKALMDFVNGLTGMSDRPKGIYLIVGTDSSSGVNSTPSAELYQAEVLAGWMYLNLAFNLNAIPVINGYCDLFWPFLAVAGDGAGATGWWSNLQCFSLDRYIKTSDFRRQPKIRYLSANLLARVTVDERQAFEAVMPSVNNGLPSDAAYKGAEPGRTDEAVQAWEALKALNAKVSDDDPEQALVDLEQLILAAGKNWAGLRGFGFTKGQEAVDEYLRNLSNAVKVFRELGEF